MPAGPIRKLANMYPGTTSRFCALKPESLQKRGAVKTLGLTDYIGPREWSPKWTILHPRYVGRWEDSPRWDKAEADLKSQK